MKFKTSTLLISLLLLSGCSEPANHPSKFMLGLGNPSSVPVGQYSEKILEYLEIDEAALLANNHITYGKDVGEVTSFIKQSSVSAGIVYKSDATTYQLKVVDYATQEMCGRVLYPAALIKNANSEIVKTATRSFLDYLTNDDAMDEFNKVGFVSACEAKDIERQVSESVNVNVFAATSLKASLNAIIEKYKTVASNVNIIPNYAASGTLQAQIENGPSACDLFISAAQKQMIALQEKNLIEVESRFDILENKVCLCVPESNPFEISNFNDLKQIYIDVMNYHYPTQEN